MGVIDGRFRIRLALPVFIPDKTAAFS